MCTSTEPKINGRPVLQPTCNRVSALDRRPMSLKKTPKKAPTIQTEPCNNSSNSNNKASKGSKTASPPVSPKLPSPRPPAVKRGKDANEMNSSREKALATPTKQNVVAKKSKNLSGGSVEAPGSIAAARKEQVAIMQVQRKMKIAHYGRTNPSKCDAKVDNSSAAVIVAEREPKRCSYITSNSDPIYVAYHDEEWGVPVHDDKLFFELLVLTGAQVGSDWTSVLKKREMFREVFSGFDAEEVAKYNEKKITSIASNSGIELGLIRGAVDNANRILEINKGFGTLAKYFWGFLNHKPISTQYKLSQRIPVKTSKSESISKDMVRRGFRFVGPTMIHSFMQAAGLTNDHLITCPRHLQCIALASQ